MRRIALLFTLASAVVYFVACTPEEQQIYENHMRLMESQSPVATPKIEDNQGVDEYTGWVDSFSWIFNLQ